MLFVREFRPLSGHSFSFHPFHLAQRKDYMMVETRPVGPGLWCFVCLVGCCVSLFLSPPSDCSSLPSTMTWAPCPHGVRTRGKKRGLLLRGWGRVALLPADFSWMGPAACELCKRLQSVDISQTENSKILEGTFAHCSQLQQLRLAERVRRIGREAFPNCASLGEIHAPPALVYIARHAFAGCMQLCILSRVGEKTTWRGTYAEYNSKPAVHSRSQGGSVFFQSHPTAKRSGQTSCASKMRKH